MEVQVHGVANLFVEQKGAKRFSELFIVSYLLKRL
jgi:hypothetical protein